MFSMYVGKVVSLEDDYHFGWIKAEIISDKGKSLKNIPYASPAFPKMFFVKPKIGEYVFVLVMNDGEANGQRLYIGPLVSQPDKMWEDLFPTTMLQNAPRPPDRSIDNVAVSKGAMPEDGDVSVLGRKNTDMILTDNDVRIRAGVRLTKPRERLVEFNKDAPAFIKLKNHEDVLEDKNGDKTKSTATIVADKINLISQNGDGHFDLSDTKEGISDKTMYEIFEKAHQLPYGDILCDFFSLFLKMYFGHTHPYPGMEPLQMDPDSVAFTQKYGSNGDVDRLKEKLLSKNIRIN